MDFVEFGTDMTFTHEGNRTLLDGAGLVNFEKMHMLAQTMRTLRYCRSRQLRKYLSILTTSLIRFVFFAASPNRLCSTWVCHVFSHRVLKPLWVAVYHSSISLVTLSTKSIWHHPFQSISVFIIAIVGL